MPLVLVLCGSIFFERGEEIFGGHCLSESSRAGVESSEASIDERWFIEGT